MTFGAKQRIFAEAAEETLLKRFLRQHSVASGVDGYVGRDDPGQLFSHCFIAYIAVQSVITDSVKSFWQNVLNHTPDELEYRKGFVFNLSGFVVVIPVADRFAIITFYPSYRDGRRYDVLCQILSQSLATRGNLSGLEESNKSVGIVFPGSVDVSLHDGIGNIVSEHGQEMVLPFSVHHAERDVSDILPLFSRINSSGGHQDMKVGVVMAGSSGGLQNDDVSDVELNAGAGGENVFETGMSSPHQRTEQFGIAIKPLSQGFRHGQDHMAVSDTGQEASSDEVGPSVGIDLGTREAKAGFAGEGNAACFSTGAASVLNKAHLLGIATVKHFLDGVVVIRAIKSWLSQLKCIPMMVENLLECVFVNAFHGCSLRTTIPELTELVEKRMCYAERSKSPRRSRDKFSASHRVTDPDGWHTLWGDAHNSWICAESLNRFVAITQGWKTNKIAERVKLRLESEDFENWSQPEVVQYEPYAEVHTHVLHEHDGLYIGLIHMVTTKDGLGDGTLDLEVSCSRDTKTWRRFAPDQYLIPRGAAGEIDCGCILAAMAPINRGDETWIYYCGNDATIRGWRRGFWCLAKMKRNRWGGFAHSGNGYGTIVTPPLLCLGNKLAINADARQGRIRVAIVEHDSLTMDAAQPIHGDVLDGEMKWDNGVDLTSVRNKQIRLRFELQDATIYGFSFE